MRISEHTLTVKFFCLKHHIDIRIGKTGNTQKGQEEYQVIFNKEGTIYTHIFYEKRPFSLYDFLFSIGQEYLDMENNPRKKMKPVFNQVFDKWARYDLKNLVAPYRVWMPSVQCTSQK